MFIPFERYWIEQKYHYPRNRSKQYCFVLHYTFNRTVFVTHTHTVLNPYYLGITFSMNRYIFRIQAKQRIKFKYNFFVFDNLTSKFYIGCLVFLYFICVNNVLALLSKCLCTSYIEKTAEIKMIFKTQNIWVRYVLSQSYNLFFFF